MAQIKKARFSVNACVVLIRAIESPAGLVPTGTQGLVTSLLDDDLFEVEFYALRRFPFRLQVRGGNLMGLADTIRKPPSAAELVARAWIEGNLENIRFKNRQREGRKDRFGPRDWGAERDSRGAVRAQRKTRR
jgi:hypothetical protein